MTKMIPMSECDRLAISKRDAENLLDVLQEWEEVMGAKELSVSDVGLDWERYEEMRARLKKFTGSEIRDLSPDVGDGR
jgi:tRNA 2-selenouridine synthase SelU